MYINFLWTYFILFHYNFVVVVRTIRNNFFSPSSNVRISFRFLFILLPKSVGIYICICILLMSVLLVTKLSLFLPNQRTLCAFIIKHIFCSYCLVCVCFFLWVLYLFFSSKYDDDMTLRALHFCCLPFLYCVCVLVCDCRVKCETLYMDGCVLKIHTHGGLSLCRG